MKFKVPLHGVTMTDLATQQLLPDWDAIRLRYEVMGESPQRLSLVFRVPADDIEALADAEGWTAISECTPNTLDSYVSQLFGSSRNKIHLMAVYRELTLMSSFHSFEDLMMHKLQQAASNIDPFDKGAPRNLQSLMGAYEKIADRYQKVNSTLLAAMQSSDKGKTISLTVDISGGKDA